MLAQSKRLVTLLFAGALLWLPATSGATPLGLSPGDLISSLEWDSLLDGSGGPGGDGGSYSDATGDTVMDGRITSVTVQGPTTSPISGVDFNLAATLDSVSVVPIGGTLVLVSVTFVGDSGSDITLSDGTGTILTAELAASGLTVGGIYDTSTSLLDATGVANAVDITITGGDVDLVNALGGMGGGASLDLDGTLFDFSPDLATILADFSLNEDFVYSGTGTIQPNAPAPFVPEPGTLLLFGSGLVGLAGLGSRQSRR